MIAQMSQARTEQTYSVWRQTPPPGRLQPHAYLVYAPLMSAQVEHYNPIGKTDSLDTWRKRMRIPVPTKTGNIVDVRIATLYETTNVNGLPLDALVEGQIVKDKPAPATPGVPGNHLHVD